MAGGREYSAYQRKIINRYYDNIDTIAITRLGEISTEMVLAVGDEKKLDRLWKRAEQALDKVRGSGGEASGERDPEIERVLEKRDVEGLGRLVTRLSR